MDQVLEASEGRGVLVMDRGADRGELPVCWIDAGRRFVIGQRGDRQVILPNGVHIEVSLLMDRLLQASSGPIVYQQVSLPDRPEAPLWLVAKVLPGKDHPLC
ncbi:hypothetical protein [Fontivita pretiosa]|uniref:hypothetical protein n=1 Tax=Fontivita pretiosa TaxID=2989684 RepID=UPI003D18716D